MRGDRRRPDLLRCIVQILNQTLVAVEPFGKPLPISGRQIEPRQPSLEKALRHRLCSQARVVNARPLLHLGSLEATSQWPVGEKAKKVAVV
jgi:hypothetical protein